MIFFRTVFVTLKVVPLSAATSGKETFHRTKLSEMKSTVGLSVWYRMTDFTKCNAMFYWNLLQAHEYAHDTSEITRRYSCSYEEVFVQMLLRQCWFLFVFTVCSFWSGMLSLEACFIKRMFIVRVPTIHFTHYLFHTVILTRSVYSSYVCTCTQ